MNFKVDFGKAYDAVGWDLRPYAHFLRVWGSLESMDSRPSSLFKKQSGVGAIHCIQIDNPGITIPHLFYTDGAVILSEWNDDSLRNMLAVFNSFHLSSGLKLNVAKFHLYGIGVNEVILDDFVQELGCSKGEFFMGDDLKALHGTFAGLDGDGRSIQFWKDNWRGDGALKDMYGRLFHLEVDEKCVLADRCSSNGWNWLWSRDIGVRIEAKLHDLISELALLHTRQNLSRKGIEIEELGCVTCKSGIESIKHVMFECILATDLWYKIRIWINLSIPIFADWNELTSWLDNWRASE
ncbi:uncharacterized protein [Rutidosis leptorrhynchoides]|uniref:uncharacterized protein n=1 Tax=Rutidosis leptorrhynchoides TaxID=125765 RepID=UPI003A9982C2